MSTRTCWNVIVLRQILSSTILFFSFFTLVRWNLFLVTRFVTTVIVKNSFNKVIFELSRCMQLKSDLNFRKQIEVARRKGKQRCCLENPCQKCTCKFHSENIKRFIAEKRVLKRLVHKNERRYQLMVFRSFELWRDSFCSRLIMIHREKSTTSLSVACICNIETTGCEKTNLSDYDFLFASWSISS